MNWVKNSRGDWHNIAAAVRGRVIDTRAGKRVQLQDARGDELAVVDADALDPPQTVIAGPLAACFVSPTGEVQWRAVAAWSVDRTTGRAEPVIAGSPASGEMFVEFADGSLLGMNQRFADLKAAIKAVREAAETRGFVQ